MADSVMYDGKPYSHQAAFHMKASMSREQKVEVSIPSNIILSADASWWVTARINELWPSLSFTVQSAPAASKLLSAARLPHLTA